MTAGVAKHVVDIGFIVEGEIIVVVQRSTANIEVNIVLSEQTPIQDESSVTVKMTV